MFQLTKLSAEQVRRCLDSARQQDFSYAETGMTRGGLPAGYQSDHNRIALGSGQAVFAKAVAAIRGWKMFDFGWLELFPAGAPIEEGITVCVRVQHYGFWSLNACRIVYTIDEDGPVMRFGFAYGTVADHAERGEERFSVEWNREDDSVWYDLLAFSRPRHPLARIGYPLARLMQKRFARDSKRAMHRAVNG